MSKYIGNIAGAIGAAQLAVRAKRYDAISSLGSDEHLEVLDFYLKGLTPDRLDEYAHAAELLARRAEKVRQDVTNERVKAEIDALKNRSEENDD